jgi:peptidoglycan/LPS O-acetylase OafA/YrhL
MESSGQDKALRIALIVVGVIYLFALYPLTLVWPDGFMWEPRQTEYEQMILITFAVLGIFLLLASREPSKYRSLIGFAAWSSLAHGLVMLVQALRDPMERANLYGDIPALVVVGVVLLVLNRPPASGFAGSEERSSAVT